MHYLVTGGCGFIGSHLVERLLAGGHLVTVIDDLSSGRRDNIPAQAGLLVSDITTPGIFDSVIENIDGCFHLAAIVSVQRSMTEWLRTHQVNVDGTVALFDALARRGRRIPVVFASSAAVYGDSQELPLKETAHCAPLSAYGADKLACEWHGRLAAQAHGIPTTGLRFFNAYGPRQDASSPYSGVISIFASRMRAGKALTIFGDGGQSRDFIYVGDAVNALAASMQALEAQRLTHGVFNICTGISTTINDLAKAMASVSGSNSEIRHASPRAGDIRASVGDPALAAKEFGFRVSIPLQEGLKRLMAE
ncbi:MAG: NAD-dependent epimerase/dehydratase family protein [Pseudomonadota bacterium]|nr:NAD-dependent epimerase/dehydratase family protein [Pseudomonadota bacterium]